MMFRTRLDFRGHFLRVMIFLRSCAPNPAISSVPFTNVSSKLGLADTVTDTCCCLPVIFEYKARLEKSLAEEKSSNAAVKQELQQRASREKSLRDKNSVEAMQRFNSLQQTYKLLQTEHQDLQEECKKREKQALDETSRLETTLQDLRGRLRQTQEEKVKSIENLKTKYTNLQVNMQRLQVKYNEQMNMKGNTIIQLQKEVSQLKHELEKVKVRVRTIS